MSHQQDVARIEEQIENSPAAAVRSTRLLLAALNEVQADRNRLEAENAELRKALKSLYLEVPEPGLSARHAMRVALERAEAALGMVKDSP